MTMRVHAVSRCQLLALVFLCCALLPVRAFAQAAAPARAYLYLEPYSGRFECLVRVADMRELLGEPASATLPFAAQARLKDLAMRKASRWLEIQVDGKAVETKEPARVSVIKGVPGRTEPVKPEETLDAGESMVGFVWEFDMASTPEKVSVQWHGFDGPVTSLTVSAVAGKQSEEFTLDPGQPWHDWVNRGRLNPLAPLVEVPQPPPPEKIRVPLGSILWLIFGSIFLSRHRGRGHRLPGRAIATWMSLILGAAVLWPVMSIETEAPWGGERPVTSERAEKILSALLRNVYKAFDHREESEIYDVLERSIHGELLQKIYLETVKALTLDEQDATRVRIEDIRDTPNPYVEVDGVRMLGAGKGFVATTQWTVIGNVGHWGHQHQRINRYRAKVTVSSVAPDAASNPAGATAWKITALDIEEERRI